jgi:hypothetical protein
MNVLEQIDQANAAHTLHLKTMILDGVRDLLFGETATSLNTPLPPLAKVVDNVGSLKRKAKGQKRSASDLAVVVAELNHYIAKNPGQRIEQIGKSLGVSTRELALPAKKLIASGAVKTRGQKRATVYVPASKAARQ